MFEIRKPKYTVIFIVAFSLLYLSNIWAKETNYIQFRFVGDKGCEKCDKFASTNLKEEIWIEKNVALSDNDVSNIELKMRKMPATVEDVKKLLQHEKTSVQYKEVPLIQITFTEQGKEKLMQVTAQNLKRKLAVFLNNQLLGTPVIAEKVESGQLEIGGNFTKKEAEKLVEGFRK